MKYFIALLVFFTSCQKRNDIVVEGYIPIYNKLSNGDEFNIENQAPRYILSVGNIYLWKNYLLVSEVNKGIHIIDAKNPDSTKLVSFINIEGNSNFVIKNNILYADNGRDLLTIDIQDIFDVKLLDIKYNALKYNVQSPPIPSVYYECVDTSKGRVVGWQKATIKNPKCKSL